MFLILGTFRANDYSFDDKTSIGGASDNRGWKKNLLEVNHLQNKILI